MAKKQTARAKQTAQAKATREQAARQEKHDKQYGNPLYSLTYEMDELEFSRASGLTKPDSIKTVLASISAICLVLIIVLLLQDRNNLTIAIILVAASLVCTAASSSWADILVRYARRSTLGLVGKDNHRHIVLTEDEVIEEGPDDRVERYPLSELQFVRSTDSYALAGFGSKRFVYIPRSSMSEGRYRGAVRFLEQHTEK